MDFLFIVILVCVVVAFLAFIRSYQSNKEYEELSAKALKELNVRNWNFVSYFDETVHVKSYHALTRYDHFKFFSENKDKIEKAERIIKKKKDIVQALDRILENKEYKSNPQYGKLKEQVNSTIKKASAYRIGVVYVTPSGRTTHQTELIVTQNDINKIKKDPTLLMSKNEYNAYVKEQQKQALNKKQHLYYEKLNSIIDYASNNREQLIIKGNQNQLDNLIYQLYDRTVNNIRKVKVIDSEEWNVIDGFMDRINGEIEKIVSMNSKLLQYYSSAEFSKIKETCKELMSSQREFNEYIEEKIQSISHLFGTRVIRNDTAIEDEYNYIRPYKKSITPFVAEVSAAVFASAENSPLEYVVKNFYPNKNLYPEQIQKLHILIEELETLKEAKQIIENYKLEYKQYLNDVPEYILQFDESGFYSRLGFANIDESVLVVEYKFSYTSGGGMAQRSFTVPMTEETITELINLLGSKLTMRSFVKEQRILMTKRLRDLIKARDNYTCCNCGNSTYTEPNLLLEIDHIIPVTKGGYTVESNLQTLCWKCNRAKSNKITSC